MLSDAEHEHALAEWLDEQVQAHIKGELSRAQLTMLRSVPAIAPLFEPRNASASEHALADWLDAQVEAHIKGQLSMKQLAKLRSVPAIAHRFKPRNHFL